MPTEHPADTNDRSGAGWITTRRSAIALALVVLVAVIVVLVTSVATMPRPGRSRAVQTIRRRGTRSSATR